MKEDGIDSSKSVVLSRLSLSHSLRSRKEVRDLAPLLASSLFPGESLLTLYQERGIRIEDADWDEERVVDDLLRSANRRLILVEEDDEKILSQGPPRSDRSIVVRRHGSLCSLVSLSPGDLRSLESRLNIHPSLPVPGRRSYAVALSSLCFLSFLVVWWCG